MYDTLSVSMTQSALSCPLIIAIDGPAGAGKSTVARRLAAQLSYTYIDSGAMYRGVALLAADAGIATTDAAALHELAQGATIAFASDGENEQRVIINGTDRTAALRTPDISAQASIVAAIPAVRRALVKKQQAMGTMGSVVMEGRDIGTVVFPYAQIKIFLTASPLERARRRWADLTAKGIETTVEAVLEDQNRRDERDAKRTDSPLMAAPDAVTLDTDGQSTDTVIETILRLVHPVSGVTR